MFQLRYYQSEAVAAAWEFLCTKSGNPCIEIPTGGGKSAVIATLAADAVNSFAGRVIVLAHVKELLEQNAAALRAIQPDLDVGIYSAGLGFREHKNAVVVAGIQSVFDKADKIGKVNLVLIDEVHLLQPDGEGRYNEFLNDMRVINPGLKVVGLTATPYRLSSGLICGPDNILNAVCYKIGVRKLIDEGYLTKLTSKRGLNLDFSSLHIQRGEFVASEADKLMGNVVPEAVGEILKYTSDRRSVLIFCQGREHAKAVQARLQQQGEVCGYVDGDSLDRAETLRDFKAGRLKYLVNIQVLTTGFDAPNIDCICLLRPTASPGLYYQAVGRSFRNSPGKTNALILDFGGNVERHGPVDCIEIRDRKASVGEPVVKVCPDCATIIAAGCAVCPHCGYAFPDRQATTHERQASEAKIISEPEEFVVRDCAYGVHHKRSDPNAPPTFRVYYRIGAGQSVSEYVCLEHTGFARSKAERWWREHSREPVPETCSAAVQCARDGLIVNTIKIVARQEGAFWRVLRSEFGAMPETREALLAVDEDEVPF